MKTRKPLILLALTLVMGLLSGCSIPGFDFGFSSSSSASSSEGSSTSANGSSSAGGSSSSAGSSSSSSATGSSSSSQTSWDYDDLPVSTYRVAPVKGESADLKVYNVDGTVNRTLKKSSEADSSTWYVSYEDVALYYQGYGKLPANYVYGTDSEAKSDAYNRFGRKGRLYTQYYSRTDGYMAAIPTPNEYSYFEADIGGSSSYASGSSWSRGTYRLVIIPGGLRQYGSDPTLFYTTDHYESFRECGNFAGAWSAIFDGEGSGFGDYAALNTITLP